MTALLQINDINPDRKVLKLWPRGRRIDPARLERLSLKSRRLSTGQAIGFEWGGVFASPVGLDTESVFGLP